MPSGYSGYTLADLMRQRGDDEARAHLQRGDIAAQGWMNAGNAITGAISGWQRDVEANRQRELEMAREGRRAEAEGIQMETARMGLAEKKRATEGAATTRAVLPLARRQNGVVGYDRDLIQREMETAGHADLVPQIFQQLDEQEASHAKVIEARRDAIAGDAWRVVQGGRTDPETFNALADLWTENDLAPKREIDALRTVAEKEGVERALMAAVVSSPKYAELLQKAQEANAPDLATVAPGSSVYDKRNPEAGPLFTAPQEPKTPANIEAAILQETDPAKRADLIALKEQFARAGRAQAQPPQPAAVQRGAVINDAGELIEGYFDPRERSWYQMDGSRITNPKPASSREQGRQVTSGDAGRIAELDTSLDDVAVLRQAISGNDSTGTAAQIGAALPKWVTDVTGWGTDAKSKNAVIARVRQVIGKALEGGVLRKEDEYKYRDILPTIGDPPELVQTKIDGLEEAIALRKQRELDAREDAGYDVTKFRQRGQAGPGAAGQVRMTAPDGRVLMVPADKVDEAKRRGAKVGG